MNISTLRLFFAMSILICIGGCNFGGDKEKKATENNGEPATNAVKNSNVYLEADVWRSWSPSKELMGYTLVRFVTDPFKLQGLNSTTARYEKDEVFITVQVVDGNSEKGKREIRDHLAIANLERDYSSDYGYEKTLMHNGIKAKEEYLAPPAGQYLIKFMLKDQYGVSVKSNAETSDEIWGFIDRLNLEDLK
ncbi:hypothetical protein [Flagellimonas lutaonensis]|uniref:Uncharacterized protein n=1 Tax=Flagellimonas lutaonensis TaxID=516051 RepID=A0A0D5YTD3_9FLAO|nr:hypothetical protein [Allomuricauda lutaonensis]AKA35159.1 hypothetical protein VC82_1540 [Allomuricauda lutaonensis]